MGMYSTKELSQHRADFADLIEAALAMNITGLRTDYFPIFMESSKNPGHWYITPAGLALVGKVGNIQKAIELFEERKTEWGNEYNNIGHYLDIHPFLLKNADREAYKGVPITDIVQRVRKGLL